jgi:hypothetical protein
MSCCDEKPNQQAERTGVMGWMQGPRKWWLFAALALAVAGGLTFGWETLVVMGIAPILLSLLPCLVMCGLGLCMMKCKDKTAKTTDASTAASVQAKESQVTAAASPRETA